MVNANTINTFSANDTSSKLIFVCNRQDRNLKCSAMRISNQCKLSAGLITRSIDFIVFKSVNRDDDVIPLTRKSSSFQTDSRGVTTFCKLFKIILLDCWVIESRDLLEFSLLICLGKIELFLDHLKRLLSKKLRRQSILPIIPVSFIRTLVNETKLSTFSRCGNPCPSLGVVPILTTLVGIFNRRPKWVVRIIFDLFEDILHWSATLLIGVKDNVNTIGHIIRICSHALNVMSVINKDPDLSKSRFSKREIRHTATKLDQTVSLNTAIFVIPDHHSLGVHTCRIIELLFVGFAAVSSDVIFNGVDSIEVIDLFMFSARRAKNQLRGKFAGIVNLFESTTINVVPFFFE